MKHIQDYTAYQLRPRNRLRQLVRDWYLESAARLVKGRGIDLGCGPGELLQRLPEGSIGLEVNPALVQHCRSRGMDVRLYDPQGDCYRLADLTPGAYDSLILSHVLEHLQCPAESLRTLLHSARRLALRRVLVIVPGKKGFASDPTHRHHIDAGFFKANSLESTAGYKIAAQNSFPGNIRLLGSVFTHHEFRIVYDSVNSP